VSMTIIALLLLSEVVEYRALSVSSEMFIDINRGGDNMLMNVDVDFPYLPCDLLSLDV
jgi:hypothetical protein